MGISPSLMRAAEPVGRHSPSNRVNLFKIGKKVQRIRLWYGTRLMTSANEDCGPFYRVKELPCSERHHSGESIEIRGDQHIPTGGFYRRCGWQPMHTIPAGWEEVNEKAWAKKRELDAARHDTPQAKALRDLIANQSASSFQIAQAMQEMVSMQTAQRAEAQAEKAQKAEGKK